MGFWKEAVEALGENMSWVNPIDAALKART